MWEFTGVKGTDMEDNFGPVETRIRERLVEDQPVETCLYACVVDLAREIDKLNVVEKKEVLEFVAISVKEGKFMKRFGWEFSAESPAIKHDPQTGKVLAHEGDETWDRDLKVAGE